MRRHAADDATHRSWRRTRRIARRTRTRRAMVTAHAHGACTTRRRRWRSRSSCWRSARCSPATSACRTRSAATTGSAPGSRRRLQPPVAGVAAAGRSGRRGRGCRRGRSRTAEHIGARADADGVSSVDRRSAASASAAFIWLKRREHRRPRWRAASAALHRLLLNKYYVDELYDAPIVQPVMRVSRDGLWRGVDVRRHRRRRERRRRHRRGRRRRAAPAADRLGARLRRLAVRRRRR